MKWKARDKAEAGTLALHRLSLRRPFMPLFLTCLLAQVPLWAEAADIDEASIQKLEESLTATVDIESTTQKRRALKRIVRNSLSLLKQHAQSPNRFAVLGIVFRTQKELLILKNDKRNREALLETCGKLALAPYEYAAERLEADVLLLQLELDRKGATEYEQALGIAELADRYRGTPAEVDSLIIVSELAFDLGQAQLLKALRSTLSSKFRESAKAIGFLKDRFAFKSSSLLFRGRFKRLDGETMVLPIDRAGHVYLSCFWSTRLNDLKSRLLAIKDLQKKYPGRFEVLSFNLDELPDAGKSTLRALSLDWRPLHLPEGSDNQLFRSSGSNPQFLIRITSANGYIILTPIGSTYRTYGRVTDLDEYLKITLDKARFLSMAQTLRIGEFLVSGPAEGQDAGLPAESLRAIQACFVAPPMRYRLTKEQAFKNYAEAAGLGADVIAQHPDSEHLWSVYNRRIIALLGQWNLSGEPRYLREAVQAATTVLASTIPREAEVVPRFCLAKEALRQRDADAEAVLSDFMKATGDEKASALSIAAATVLSLDAGSPVLFHRYREILLDEHMDDRRLWPLTAYVFNKFVVGRLFRGNYYSSDVRIYHGFRKWQQSTEIRPRKFLMRLENLAGETVDFPHPDGEKSNVVVFMDLPADGASAKVQVDLVKHLEAMADSHLLKNVNLLLAFVSENRNAVRGLARRNGWDAGRIAFVPEGMRNQHVLRLGIFLADQRPNTFTVASDGTITWSITGMYQMSMGANGVADTVKRKVQAHDLATGNAALESREFEKALRIFKGSFPPGRFFPGQAGNAQRRGRAQAHKGMGNHEAALKEYDQIMAEHATAATRNPCACHSLGRKLRVRADILEKLGKETEAALDRQRAEHLACPRGGRIRFRADRFEQELYNKLEGSIYRKDWASAHKYIDDVIVHSKDGRRAQREALAELLRERAETEAHLRENEKARSDRRWAEALTKGIDAAATASGAQPRESQRPRRYADIVREERN